MITLTKEEAQQVLDAMECKQPFLKNALSSYGISTDEIEKMAIETLRARLAEKEQEPVAWKYETPAYVSLQWKQRGDWRDGTWTALYTAPPQREWQGLTDEEIRNEANHHVFDESFFNGAVWARGKIKEKNNG